MNNEERLKIAGMVASVTLSNFDHYRDVLTAANGDALALLTTEAGVVLGTTFQSNVEQAFGSSSSVYSDQIGTWNSAGITLVPLGDPNYPASLARTNDPPPLLWIKGSYQSWLARRPLFTIVGSRKATIEACDIACLFAEHIVRTMPIVSGLALGIDAAAHRGSLRSNAGSIPGVAVLGNGIDSLYPERNAELGRAIVDHGGVILSQFKPGTPPYPANFLNRNRVIAGLSCAGLIVQAGARSGSLNTARHLVDQGKEVFVVPGSIRFGGYEGSHSLLKDGAVLVTSPQDILEHLGFPAETTHSEENLSAPCAIQQALQAGAMGMFELQQLLGNEASLLSQIIELEISGKIVALPGDRYALSMNSSPRANQ